MPHTSIHFFRVFAISFCILFLSALQTTVVAQFYEVINYTSYRTVEKGKLIEENEILVQINDRMGEKYNKFEISYSPRNKLKSLDAQIEDLYGKVIRKLKKSEIENSSAVSSGTLYQDEFVSKFSLKHNRYPYRIRISYKTEYSEFLDIAYWSPVKSYDVPIRNAELVVKVPDSYSIHYKQKNTDDPEITEEEGMKVYTWKASYLKTIEEELYSPPMSNFMPEVIVVPEEFVYGIPGSFADWESFGLWSYKLMNGLDELPYEEKRKVRSLLKDLKTDREKAKALYHYMQDNTRYINVSIDIGGLKPYPAEYVSYNKYGDCKALTNYMKSLLKEAGIESYYSKIFADEQIPPFDSDFPMQFSNHAILNVPLDKDTLWLECTSSTTPFGYLSPSIQNRYALKVDSNASMLVKTPAMEDTEILTKRYIGFDFKIDGNAMAEFNIVARGDLFEALQSFNSYASEHYKNQIIKKMFNFSSYEMINWTIDQIHRDSSFVDLNASLLLHDHAKIYNKDIIVKVLPANIPDFEHTSKRSLPVQIDYPIAQRDELVYHWPESWEPEVIPEVKSLKTKYGEYTFDMEIGKDAIIVKRYFKLNPGFYQMDEYKQFYEFIESVNQLERNNAFIFK